MVKKQFIIGIILITSIALLGIMLVQFFWIRNAIAIKEANFNRGVSEALQDVVLRLNRDQDVMFVSNQVWVDDQDMDDNVFFGDTVVWEYEGDDDNAFVYVRESESSVSAVTVGTGTNESSFIRVESLGDSNIRHRTIIRLDSMKQLYDEKQESILAELKDSMEIILDDKIRQVRHKTISVNEVIDDMVYELQVMDKPLDEQLDRKSVV